MLVLFPDWEEFDEVLFELVTSARDCSSANNKIATTKIPIALHFIIYVFLVAALPK